MEKEEHREAINDEATEGGLAAEDAEKLTEVAQMDSSDEVLWRPQCSH